jgi:hypothetical protein
MTATAQVYEALPHGVSLVEKMPCPGDVLWTIAGAPRSDRVGQNKSWVRAIVRAMLALWIMGFAIESKAQEDRWPPTEGLRFTRFANLYVSTDMSPIRLILEGWRADRTRTFSASLNVSRAYIVYIAAGDPREAQSLRTIRPVTAGQRTDTIVVAMTEPDWRPLSVHVRELMSSRGINLVQAITALRSQIRIVTLRGHDERVFRMPAGLGDPPPPRPDPSITLDGLQGRTGARSPDGSFLFRGEAGRDEFTHLACLRGRSGEVPVWNCDVLQFALSPAVFATTDFANLPLQGGRAMANDRARVLTAAVCRYLDPPCAR